MNSNTINIFLKNGVTVKYNVASASMFNKIMAAIQNGDKTFHKNELFIDLTEVAAITYDRK